MTETVSDLPLWQSALAAALIVGVAAAIGVAVHALLFSLIRRVMASAESETGTHFVRRARRPARLILPLLAIHLFLPLLATLVPEPVLSPLGHLLALGLIVGLAWLVISASHVIDDVLGVRYRLDVRDNLAARRVHTQARMLRRAIIVVIVILTAAVMLMTFPQVRALGASMLASAGLAGIVVGFAARPVLQNLIAGVQIAITQPIRIDDVVIVEGEWGRIEEFTSTYVVVRVWDERRLIVPLNYFIENTFQNWTRSSADILGTVFLFADYSVPVGDMRSELHRLLRENDKWDGRAWGLVVTGATDRAVELRALMSAADAGTAWELRCEIRESLIEWLQEHHPRSLPKVRATMGGEPPPARSSSPSPRDG